MTTSLVDASKLKTVNHNTNIIFNNTTNNEVDLYNHTIVKLKNDTDSKSIVFCVSLAHFEKGKNYDSLVKYLKYTINRGIDLSNSLYSKETIIFIINFKHTKLKQMDHKFFKELILILKTEYVDIVDKIIMKNIPVFFKVGYSIVKHFIDQETRRKIYFEKKNKNGDNVSYTTNFKEIEDNL